MKNPLIHLNKYYIILSDPNGAPLQQAAGYSVECE
jgi:hypothetical protein